MSAPHLSTLPEYEPPLCLVPPAEPDEPPLPWPREPVPLPVVSDPPAWDPPGPVRDHILRLMRLVLEVLDGRRPLAQLRGVVTGPAYDALFTRCRHTTGHHRLRTLRTCHPSPVSVEACATVLVVDPARPPTVLAIAARLVLRHDRWLCTLLRPLYPTQRVRR
jgi:hypothetical protein